MLLSGFYQSHALLVVFVAPSLELCNLFGLLRCGGLFFLPVSVLDCLEFDLHLIDIFPSVPKFGIILSSLRVERAVPLLQILIFVA